MGVILSKSILAAILASGLAALALGQGLGPDLTVVSSSDREFHFRLSSRFSELDKRVEVDSSMTLFRTVHVGIPYGADVSLRSVQGDSVRPLPREARETPDRSLSSHPLVEVSQPIEVRGRQIVAVRIFPVLGEAMYSSVTVHLTFSGGFIQGGAAASDPHFHRIFKFSLANYAEFQTWPTAPRAAARVSEEAPGLFDLVPVWYKIAVNQTGLYRVSGVQLEQAGLDLRELPSDSLHLYSGEGLALDPDNTKPRPEFREIPLLVEDGGDGVFDRNDYFLFFGEAVERWLFGADHSPYFVDNPYFDRNVYWLGASGFSSAGMRMSAATAAPGGLADTVITTFANRVHTEQDNLLRRFNSGKIEDYLNWYWTNDTLLTFYVPTPGVIEGEPATIYLSGLTGDNGDPGDNLGYMDLRVNGLAGSGRTCGSAFCSYQTAALTNGLNKIELRLWPSAVAPPYFDFMDLTYRSALEPAGGVLDLPLGAFDAEARIELRDDFGSNLVLLDVTDPRQPVVLEDYERSGGLIQVQRSFSSSTFARLFAAAVADALAPLSVVSARPVNLRAAVDRVDLLVITPRVFSGQMEEYVEYRGGVSRSIAVVTVEDIMDNFAYGLYDPIAIRDFLKYAYENYPTPVPAAALLVGDGSYDYLDHLGTGVVNRVPPCIHALDESASDDNYVYFGQYGILDSDTSYDTSHVTRDRGYDMVVARWPVRTVAEIRTIMRKTRQYEAPENRGIWRTEFTLVADDEFGRFDNETFHVTQTETLEKEHIPRLFHRNKIYLWDYPFVGRLKPGANEAIVGAINDGTLVVNFVGHGNPDVWAHELVFTRTGDVPQLSNYDRLSLFFNASCAIGFFDDPRREGMAEDLLIHPAGGAVGVVSAARLVYASDNALFNRKVFDVMLYSDSLSVAEAVYTAKLLRQYGQSTTPSPEENDRAYLYFGDPCLRLGAPELDIEFSEAPVRLTALERTVVKGRVRDRRNGLYARNGVLVVNVYDSERQRTYRLLNDTGGVVQEIPYSVTGPAIYRGSASIDTGLFEFEFVTPLDVGYGGRGATITAYALFDSTDAAGLIDSLLVSDSLGSLTDSTGPIIEYSFSGRANFVSGDPVSRHDVLQVALTDSVGINLTAGLGHGITLELDGRSENVINLTHRFEYDRDDFTTGRLEYPLTDLEPGRHTFKVKAWDNANNSAAVEFAAEVLANERLAIADLLNYPNPMRDSTRFSGYLTQPVARFQLDIFTLSGRKIRSFGPLYPPVGFFDRIVWDGRDEAGDRVATGVYIYKATAVPAAGGAEAESFGKVIVIN